MTARSYLFVPGNAPAKLEKAWTRGADALIVDLEDAVPRGAEHAARGTVAAWLGAQVDAPGQIWVRVNNHPDLLGADFSAVADSPALTGIVLPKVHDAAQVGVVRDLLDGAAAGQCGLLVMVETARALVEVNAIAAMPGVSALMLGEYDLAADLGMDPDWRGSELHHARSATVVACVAAGISPPVGAVSANITDLVRFDETTRLLKRAGFQGRAVIHPAQIPIVNDVHTPDGEEVAAARRTLELFEQALESGDGALRGPDGNMLDEAIVRSARRTLEAAASAGLI